MPRGIVALRQPGPVATVSSWLCGEGLRGRVDGHEGRAGVHTVVVGVDGSLGVLNAVSWAAAEAARRGAALDLVHVTTGGRAPGHAVLHRALGTAAAVAPGVAMTTVTTPAREPGAAGPGLLAHAAGAGLLVVGGRRRADGGPSGDRTVSHLLAHARCPVVVVPPRRTGAWASTPSRRPVVAGVTAPDHDAADDVLERELALALDTARCRRAPLLVWGRRNAAVDDGARSLAGRAAALGVRRFALTEDLVGTLRRAGQRAQLIVLGPPPEPTTGTSTRHDALVDDLVARSPCPVVVAPRLVGPVTGRDRGAPATAPSSTATSSTAPSSTTASPRATHRLSPLSPTDGGVVHGYEWPDLVEPAGV